MTRLTFHGDTAVKARYLDRLRDHVAAGDFRFDPVWQDGKGTALGCTIEAADVALYAETLGYPDVLAMVLDALVNFQPAHPDRAHATDFAIRWLAETPVGVDLSAVSGAVLYDMLDWLLVRDAVRAHPAIDASRRAVIALHRAAIAGMPASRDEWREARREAVRVTDGTTDEIARLAAAVVEAAAWPHETRTVLAETLSAMSRLVGAVAMFEIGWTSAKEDAVFAMFEAVSNEAAGDPPVGEALLAEVARRDPELAAQFAARCDAMMVAQMIYSETGASVLRHIAAAPAPASGDHTA